ncbi:hypothetical protein O6H91_21G061100 [Diphasiastrum complanatum]|uniref:Uncharacterized protein n=1 Tax=Diphasiastrum complanatum TaxID=34168 RepID=A0ACC2AL10_DIPCM|nr:hypothetical protein O6H91_21G061100 [Diphasiastrum complanatum]
MVLSWANALPFEGLLTDLAFNQFNGWKLEEVAMALEWDLLLPSASIVASCLTDETRLLLVLFHNLTLTFPVVVIEDSVENAQKLMVTEGSVKNAQKLTVWNCRFNGKCSKCYRN